MASTTSNSGLSKEDFKSKVTQAVDTAQDFVKLYYSTFDKKRHEVHKFYMTSAVILWNGNKFKGVEDIKKFVESLPSSEHSQETLNAQPISEIAIPGTQTTILVKSAGFVKFKGSDAGTYCQSFILTPEDNKWKIVSDTFRSQEC